MTRLTKIKLVLHVGYTETLLMGKHKNCKIHLLTLLLGREHRTKAKSEEKVKQVKGSVDNLAEICSDHKSRATATQRFDTYIGGKCKETVWHDDEIDPATQSQSSKRSKVGSTENQMHSYSEEDDVEAVMQDLLYENHEHNRVTMQVLQVRRRLRIAQRRSWVGREIQLRRNWIIDVFIKS